MTNRRWRAILGVDVSKRAAKRPDQGVDLKMNSGLEKLVVLRLAAGLALGWATSFVVLSGGFVLLRASWQDYALADPEKAYTLTMLFVRLFIFSSMIAATSVVATLVSGNKYIPWVTGGLIFAMSVPPHLYPGYVWDDYPVWYHIAFLLSIIPIAVATGRFALHAFPAASYGTSAAQQTKEEHTEIAD